MVRKDFDREFKLQVVQELESGKRPSELAREHGVKVDAICRWRNEYRENPEHAFAGKGFPAKEETKTARLEQKIGQLTMEIDFVKRVNSVLQKKLVETKKKVRGEKDAVRTNQN